MPTAQPAIVLAMFCLALGACGGSSSGDPAATAQPGATAATGSPASPTDPSPAASAPAGETIRDDTMRKVFERFKSLRSYHATMQVEGTAQGPIGNEMDFVAPDRYRMTMQVQGMQVTQTMIGNDVHVSMGGRDIKTTVQGPQPGRWHEDFSKQMDTTAVEARGHESLEGVDTRKYLLRQTRPSPSESLVWIDGDDLVRQARIVTSAEGRQTTTTIRYSRFDDPSIRIDPP